jgi:hypothetical protein
MRRICLKQPRSSVGRIDTLLGEARSGNMSGKAVGKGKEKKDENKR